MISPGSSDGHGPLTLMAVSSATTSIPTRTASRSSPGWGGIVTRTHICATPHLTSSSNMNEFKFYISPVDYAKARPMTWGEAKKNNIPLSEHIPDDCTPITDDTDGYEVRWFHSFKSVWINKELLHCHLHPNETKCDSLRFELNELKKNIQCVRTSLKWGRYKDCSKEMRYLITRQYEYMNWYSEVLEKRLALLMGDEKNNEQISLPS